MTAPVAPTTTAPAGVDRTSTPFTNAVGGPMGKNEFIKLLVAQMTHQDPLNPTDGQQLASQLAQFSSVEQLMNIGDKLDAQSASGASLSAAINNSSATSLLGRDVTVATDLINVGKNGDGTKEANVDVPAGGGDLTVKITDNAGNTLHTVSIGAREQGTNTIDLAGATAGMEPGTYRVVVECSQNGAAATPLATHIKVHVDGVRFSSDGAYVTSGPFAFPIGSISAVVAGN
ncbi:MAG TPA: flagellar hook capping FlgD N-terminal domain-containing protein [Gemmatimonadaceae bacterium]|nr:flagellar hook capping FlgD N-terminal domain-containing protein [Gemmatimonadaceae bacterium]